MCKPKSVAPKVRDIVKPVDPYHSLHCGSGIYPFAICISADPLVLVSEEGDMRWSCYDYPLYVIGTATKELMKTCNRRKDR